MDTLEGFKSAFVTMVSGSISDGFDDLAASVRRSGAVVGLGLATAGFFIGVGLIMSTVLASYLEHSHTWGEDDDRLLTGSAYPSTPRRPRSAGRYFDTDEQEDMVLTEIQEEVETDN
ncbi:uncharacterized protein MONBRDRAFT_8995 [Monosiga brevicollis MX1]|uniref:Uncharacterized protein n=1 Tax=Monosiga brevicollis TaxID=81824 RepID=A9V1S0_MONBE|nr:uncharacterized protein MONBRDRAFT_8995 [Monosiga brevicollis MX1]EDQ88610.1 predicted protein [Monosiga brevicollis MX1]|eukprot:XP_001746714.1 hypothetical protein [Monosiga brevicollis MX1]